MSLCSPVHLGKTSLARAARWSCHRSWSAVAGWSSCAGTACWSSTSLYQSHALWLDWSLNGMIPGEDDVSVSFFSFFQSYSSPPYWTVYFKWQWLNKHKGHNLSFSVHWDWSSKVGLNNCLMKLLLNKKVIISNWNDGCTDLRLC